MKTRFVWTLGAHNVFGLSSSLGTPIWRESILRWCLGLCFFLGVLSCVVSHDRIARVFDEIHLLGLAIHILFLFFFLCVC